jgi:hypothetical protein
LKNLFFRCNFVALHLKAPKSQPLEPEEAKLYLERIFQCHGEAQRFTLECILVASLSNTSTFVRVVKELESRKTFVLTDDLCLTVCSLRQHLTPANLAG